MSALFEELDYCPTPIGALSLRRRRDLARGVDVFEILLGDEYLMTSLFTASEVALGKLGVKACAEASNGETALEIVVGGLGLGYTALAALEAAGQTSRPIAELRVVDYLAPVIDWHRRGLLPVGTSLVEDPRCRLVEGDFFAMAAGDGFDGDEPGRRFDAILVDIDHSPDALLDARSDGFYHAESLTALQRFLKPGGVFGLWANDPPDERFLTRLRACFAEAWAEPVTFDNPVTEQRFTQAVYLARRA